MRSKIDKALINANSIDEVKKLLLGVLKGVRTEGSTQIGYVAGILTSDGPQNIDKNVKRLRKFTDKIRAENGYPIFSSTDVISDHLFKKLGAKLFERADWEEFWREVLGTKEKFVTDIFMTPRWQESRGATDEHKTAKENGLKIHYL